MTALVHTITAKSIIVECETSIAGASVRSNIVVTVLVTLIYSSGALINIYN